MLDETQQKGQRGGGVRNPARWERHSIRDETQVPEPEPQAEQSKPVSQSKLGELRAHQEEMEARAKLREEERLELGTGTPADLDSDELDELFV